MHGNERPSSWRKRMQEAVAVVALVWATQTLQHRWDLAHADLYQPATANAVGRTAASGVLVGLESHVYDTQLDVTQGSLRETNRPLDAAIQGNGYYAIKIRPGVGNGIGYTRSGNFFVNNKNEIVVGIGEGYRLVPPIIVPPGTTSVCVGQDGSIEAQQGVPKVKIGQLQLTRFRNPELLLPLGKNIYQQTDASGPPITASPGEQGAGLVMQGFLEELNADPVARPVTQQKTQRAS